MCPNSASRLVVDFLLCGAEILDVECYRYMAHLANKPRTLAFLEFKYQQYLRFHPEMGRYLFEQVMIELARRELLVCKDEKWMVTPIAMFYINRFHGGI
jgi:hypothetical protein